MGSSYCRRGGVDKAAVICQLHSIMDHYLLGEGNWPTDTEALPALYKTFRELGEVVEGSIMVRVMKI